ncbi:MBL fold metallo-hydrolase [Patescibacteria group bacterium]|nr:MBL fold metallo-hydrolase [Patescibacteria group bacterium]MBU1246712.1 MBL fold metallo-hydrolase [Patescibacteria group bacterium]MBU1519523.1 MBL fold metallo-hydrolase [Patescibacteria group bacterium]MBU1730105.1 MBL fold metallo-hydrolase [Patescibacteria group bacterium]MBU1956608.1 MBL fold metallo-hydrolase [Patescibacteria group bacterium]
MIITYYGSEFIKLQAGDTVLAFNPVAKESTFRSYRFGADIVLVSVNNPDFNGVDNLIYKDKKPFVVSGPGEYEKNSIFIKGFLTKVIYKGKSYINTIYLVKFDHIKICHLGILNSVDQLTNDIKEEINGTDILFAPIEGEDVLDQDEMNRTSISIGAKITIPIYHNASSKKELDALVKKIGNGVSVAEKLTIKKSDFSDKEGEVVILTTPSL